MIIIKRKKIIPVLRYINNLFFKRNYIMNKLRVFFNYAAIMAA